MADTPPTDLIELGRNVDNCDRHGGSWCSCKVRQFLSLLSEWMGDSLVDRTWTRWDRRREATYCTTHGRFHLGHGHFVGAVCPNDAGCALVPLFTLTPRED